MILTATLRGVEARRVRVHAKRSAGAAGLHIQGLAAVAERESRIRVTAALDACGRRIDDETQVTCDAGGAAIDGGGTDLAAALAVVGSSDDDAVGAIGELSLSGEVRPVRGALPAVEALKSHARVVIVATENAREAALVGGVRIVAVRHLRDAIAFLAGDERNVDVVTLPNPQQTIAPLDMRDIRGAQHARRALEIAAAGGHSVLFVGAPGAGKTMLARRLPGILPPLTEAEALEVTRVHSVAGLNVGGGLISTRPFRAPHHSTTPPGLVGGGATSPRPGEMTLAHNGVLFLDELPEFARSSLEVLREPMEAGEVVLARASGTVRYPARCLVVASMAPCPCGRFPDPRCRCVDADRARYQARVSPRLMDVFDLRVTLAPLDVAAVERSPAGESSAVVAARVAQARSQLRRVEKATADDEAGARSLLTGREFSTRAAFNRALRVAWTIAALDGAATISAHHADEAVELVRHL